MLPPQKQERNSSERPNSSEGPSLAVKEIALRGYFIDGLQTDEELAEFLNEYLGIKIPDKRICPDHQAPFSFISDVFFGRVTDAIVWACRSGGKSFNEALLTFLDSHFHEKCDTTVLAGSFYQGKQVYGATLDLWDRPGWAAYLVGDPTKSETLLRNGSDYEVLTASQKSVRAGFRCRR